MKKHFEMGRRLAAFLVAAGFSFCFALPVEGQFNSPVGTWDCVLSGKRDGTAYLTFLDDGTFSGFEVLVPRTPKNNSPSDDGRNSGGTGTRDGSGTPPSDGPGSQQVFGGELPTGPWFFDNKGRIIGYFLEVSQLESCETNALPISTNTFIDFVPLASQTNDFCPSDPFLANVFSTSSTIGTNTSNGTYTNEIVCYTNVVVCSALTNEISFVGKVVPGRRLTLVCTTPFGRTIYRGVPARVLPDISGDWYGTKKQSGVTYQEFLTVSPSGLPFPNTYDVTGLGPSYSYQGIGVLSSRKKISFVFGMDPPLPADPVTVIRSVTGPFNPTKVQAKTKGYDQPAGELTDKATFKATRFAQ